MLIIAALVFVVSFGVAVHYGLAETDHFCRDPNLLDGRFETKCDFWGVDPGKTYRRVAEYSVTFLLFVGPSFGLLRLAGNGRLRRALHRFWYGSETQQS